MERRKAKIISGRLLAKSVVPEGVGHRMRLGRYGVMSFDGAFCLPVLSRKLL